MVSMSCVKYLISCGVAGNCLILNPHRYGLPIGKRIESIWRTVLPQYPLIYCPINNFTDGLEFHVQKSDMGFVSFTGDVEAGNAFYHFIAQKSEILAESEFLLMSSDTAYVLKDVTEVQLRKAAENLATAAFMGGGNLFNSVKRIYVDRELLSKFI
jgi:acyl-CoA reductase-like NAD-dependent aldehyde dehydrogenase